MSIVRSPLTTALIGGSVFLAAGVAGMTVKAQIQKIFIIETVNPSAPCNGLFFPCWLTAKGATLVNPVTDLNDYYVNINAPITLDEFKFKNRCIDSNGSPLNPGFKAFYFNNGDLQLGREMHCNQNGVYVACYVSNYGPQPYPPGTPDNNTTYPNVEQALAEVEEVSPNGPGTFCFSLPGSPFQICFRTPHPFATVAMESIPPAPPPKTVSVREADGFSGGVVPQKFCAANYDGNLPPTNADVDTGLDIETGDRIFFTATGLIWDGYCFIGTNSPDGLPGATPAENGNYDYPLPGAQEEALIAAVGPGGNYFQIGSSLTLKYNGPPGRLFLRTNDNMPGNGSGAFAVYIQIQRQSVKFYVYDNQDFRTNAAALDREGFKSVPQMCMACHGGVYNTQTNEAYGASFLPFDVFSFKYSQEPGLTLNDQQEQFRQLNRLVKNTNPSPDNTNKPIQNLIDALYDNKVDVFGTKAVLPEPPPSWQGHKALYQNFFARYCRTCHLASSVLDFYDFQTFNVPLVGAAICYGEMPHAQVPYTALAGARVDPFAAKDLTGILPCLVSSIPTKIGPPKPP